MIATEHFATDFQEFKASTAERIDKIERLIWSNVRGRDTVQTEDMKHDYSSYKMKIIELGSELECLLKVIELLSVQQINTCEINDNS